MSSGVERGVGGGLALVLKILLVTGFAGLVAGVFILIFVSVPVGLVVMLVGLSDLVAVYLLPKIAGAQK